MDLRRRDERLARALIDSYREAGGDPGDDALLTLLRRPARAHPREGRAHARRTGHRRRRRAPSGGRRRLLELAGRLGWRLRLGPVAIVCGPAASGKSTLAAALAARSGATVLSSDRVRKELLGIEPTERAPAAAYAPEVNRRTYRELGDRRPAAAAGSPSSWTPPFAYAADREVFGPSRSMPSGSSAARRPRSSPAERLRG